MCHMKLSRSYPLDAESEECNNGKRHGNVKIHVHILCLDRSSIKEPMPVKNVIVGFPVVCERGREMRGCRPAGDGRPAPPTTDQQRR